MQGVIFAFYILLLIMGAIFAFLGVLLFFQPETMLQIKSYLLASLLLGFAFMIAFVCYHKFRLQLVFLTSPEINRELERIDDNGP